MSMNKITKGYPNWDVPYNENVDEYNNTIGNEELVTTSKTIKGAINEIHNVADDVTTINADISNLKTSVSQNTSQLNAKANNIYNVFKNAKNKTVKFLGDSTGVGNCGTGYALDGEQIPGSTRRANNKGHCWVNEMRKELTSKYNCTTYNWCVGGWKSSDIVDNLDKLILDTDDIIMVAIGANNCYVDGGLYTLKSDIPTIYNYCKQKGKEVVFLGAIQSRSCAEETHGIYMQDIDNMLRECTAELNAYFVPVFKLWEDFIIYSNIDYTLLYGDEEHPSDDGYDVMYYLIANYMGVHTKLETRNKIRNIFDSGWIDLPLNTGINYDSYKPQYKRSGNDLALQGRVTGLTSDGGDIGTLPDGCRPSSPKVCICATDIDGILARVIINQGGSITVAACSKLQSSSIIYLDNINIKFN